jgi:hypothetical protein
MNNNTIHNNTIHNNTINNNTIHNNTIHNNTIHNNTIHNNTLHNTTIHGNTVNNNTISTQQRTQSKFNPLGGKGHVERHVGGAGFEDPQQGHVTLHTSWKQQGNLVFGLNIALLP